MTVRIVARAVAYVAVAAISTREIVLWWREWYSAVDTRKAQRP